MGTVGRAYWLYAGRIAFSRWQADDLPLARALWGDPAVTRYITASGLMTEAEIQARLLRETLQQARHGIQYWPLFERAAGEFLGCCGLRPYPEEEGVAEIGFHIRQARWGQGFGPEAAGAVITHAFDTLGLDALFAGHNPRNAASEKVLRRLGFVYTHDEYYAPTGLMHPSYRLTSAYFSASKMKSE